MRTAKIDATTGLLATPIWIEISVSNRSIYTEKSIVKAAISVDNVDKIGVALVNANWGLSHLKQRTRWVKTSHPCNKFVR